MPIFSVRTTAGQEDLVAEIVEKKVRAQNLEVYAIIANPDIRGYILVEAKDELNVRRAIAGVPHVKGLVPGAMDLSHIEHLLEAKPLLSAIKPGMIVKIIGGPFRGEKARVLRVDTQKEEVTVELLEAAIKIPVTIEAQYIKIEQG